MNSEDDDEIGGPFDKDPDDDIPFRGFDDKSNE
jgi:hypothetical protein